MASGPQRGTTTQTGVGAIAVAVFAVACCAGLPLVAAGIGSIALGAWLGLGAGAIVLTGLVVFGWVARRRRRCAGKERTV